MQAVVSSAQLRWQQSRPTCITFRSLNSLHFTVLRDPRALHPTNSLRNTDGSDTIYGFQCNERFLDWDESAGRQLIRIHVAKELGKDIDYVNSKLLELAAVLPDLVNKLANLKADLVLRLVKDTDAVAMRMLDLREALPGMNVSAMVAGNLWLLDEPSVQSLQQSLQSMRDALPGMSFESVLEEEPRLLLVDMKQVLRELERLLPGSDPRSILATHSGMVLGMKDAGLPASLTIDDGIQAD